MGAQLRHAVHNDAGCHNDRRMLHLRYKQLDRSGVGGRGREGGGGGGGGGGKEETPPLMHHQSKREDRAFSPFFS